MSTAVSPGPRDSVRMSSGFRGSWTRRLTGSAPGSGPVEPRPARDGFHRAMSASSACRLLPMPPPILSSAAQREDRPTAPHLSPLLAAPLSSLLQPARTSWPHGRGPSTVIPAIRSDSAFSAEAVTLCTNSVLTVTRAAVVRNKTHRIDRHRVLSAERAVARPLERHVR